MLEGWEWIIIGIVAIVIIMWGPAKIPEFAKALGRAKGEFSKASKEFTNAATMAEKETENKTSSATLTSSTNPVMESQSKDQILIDTARNLGIETAGKTKDQISEEIAAKVKSLGSN